MSCKDSREMWMKQKDEPIRVAQIMGKLWAGGVEMVVFNYYRAIDKSKIQFDFYYDADSTVEPPQDLIDMGARFYKIPPYQKLPQYIRELKKHLKENQYLIVHSHLNTLSVFPLFVAWMCRVPVRVAHNHSEKRCAEIFSPYIWTSFPNRLFCLLRKSWTLDVWK